MPNAPKQADLIISLSHDKVVVNLADHSSENLRFWSSGFAIDSLFLEEPIAQSLDQILISNQDLINHFSHVDLIMVDSPHIEIPGTGITNEKLISLLPKYLRIRSGDVVSLDAISKRSTTCYTIPVNTLQMLKEYYSNLSISHSTSILWETLSGVDREYNRTSAMYITFMCDSLVLIGSRQGKKIFSKCFDVRSEADVIYYTVSCNQMLNPEVVVLASIEHEAGSFSWPETQVLKIDQYLALPSLSTLLATYRACVS